MSEKRVTVWVQRFKDHPHLVLQWIDPNTGRRKSKSAKTADDKEADQARADHEYELNNGRYQEASRMTWERFRELFEAEFVASRRENTRRNYSVMMNLFEKFCQPKALRSISERTVSAFAAGLRKLPGDGGTTMQASSIQGTPAVPPHGVTLGCGSEAHPGVSPVPHREGAEEETAARAYRVR